MDVENALDTQEEAHSSKAEQALGARRAFVIVGVFFLVQIVTGMGFGIAAGMYFGFKVEDMDFAAMSEAMVPLTLPISLLGVVAASVVAFRMTRRTLSGPNMRDALASLGWKSSAVSQITSAALIGCVISLVSLFILGFLASPPPEGQQLGPLSTAAALGGWPRILWAIFAVALAPPIEEFIFRGVLFCGLSNAIGIRTASVIVTIIFVMAHFTEAQGHWPAWFGISLLAYAAVRLRIKTESLGPAVAAHASYNLVIVITVYLFSA